jgi:hypothetical protein
MPARDARAAGEVGELLLSPDLARALKFYDRWLPGTMRHIALITRTWRGPLELSRGG